MMDFVAVYFLNDLKFSEKKKNLFKFSEKILKKSINKILNIKIMVKLFFQ